MKYLVKITNLVNDSEYVKQLRENITNLINKSDGNFLLVDGNKVNVEIIELTT